MVGAPPLVVGPVVMDRMRAGLVVGKALLGIGRAVKPWVPSSIRKAVDDRFFGAVFQVTRVTNDNYNSGTKERPGTPDENR